MEENKDLNPEVDVEQATGTEEKTENKTEEKLTKKEKKLKAELEAEILKYKELAEKTEKARAETEDKYMRVLAEYDNFRKRTAREKDAILEFASMLPSDVFHVVYTKMMNQQNNPPEVLWITKKN